MRRVSLCEWQSAAAQERSWEGVGGGGLPPPLLLHASLPPSAFLHLYVCLPVARPFAIVHFNRYVGLLSSLRRPSLSRRERERECSPRQMTIARERLSLRSVAISCFPFKHFLGVYVMPLCQVTSSKKVEFSQFSVSRHGTF